ncbi:hypothetical protein BH09VER1_BH09VER1_42230 [soil metagenome]
MPPANSSEFFQLHDGTPATTRLIQPDDAPSLQRGLERLSETSNAYRFLHYRGRFTEADLHYLTHCDFIDHIAVILAIRNEHGLEIDQVGVARCIRSKTDPNLAEVAIVLVDEWQRLGGGRALISYLARLAWVADVRRWQAISFPDNVAILRLLSTVGTEMSRRPFGHGVIETIYELKPPSPSR